MTQADMETIPTYGIIEPSPVPDRKKCQYCKGSGYEIVHRYYPEVYGEKAPPIDYAVPCRKCNGMRPHYDRDNRNRLKLPYDAYISAFNPMIYKDAQGNPIDFKSQFKFIRDYIEKFPKVQAKSTVKGLYIHSRMGGTGKTFLASIICNEIYSRYQLMPVYITENSLLDEIEKEVSNTSQRPKEVLKQAQLLFIDDMWRKKSGREWVIDELFSIIDYRYTEGLCTIVTSNLPLTDKSIDKRIAGRLNEMCASVQMPEAEIRTQKKAEGGKELMALLKEDG